MLSTLTRCKETFRFVTYGAELFCTQWENHHGRHQFRIEEDYDPRIDDGSLEIDDMEIPKFAIVEWRRL